MSEKEINGIKLYRRRGPWRIIAYFVALTLLIAPSVIFCFKDDTDWVEPTIITSKNIGSYSVSDEDIWFRYDLMEKYFGYEHISFKNSGGTHDFIIDEFNVATKRLNGGEQDAVEFTADKTGSFEYYCSVGQHRQNGQVGTLIVEE